MVSSSSSETPLLLCANYRACSNPATIPCSSCQLVKYCSESCLESHKQSHSAHCKSPLSSPLYRPTFDTPGSTHPPAFIPKDPKNAPPVGALYTAHGLRTLAGQTITLGTATAPLWGTTPAYGSSPLATELTTREDIKDILFAACGDLRNPITLLNAIRQKDVGRKIRVVLNDMMPYVTIRNLIVLILIGEGFIDEAISVWFDVTLTPETHKIMRSVVTHYFRDLPILLAETMERSGAAKEVEKTIVVRGQVVVVARLPVYAWQILIDWMTDDWGAHGGAEAREKRRKVVRAEERQDWWEQRMAETRPEWRESISCYSEDGILAPFGDEALREAATMPNPTHFTAGTKSYLSYETASPLHAFPFPSSSPSSSPANDLLGNLFSYIHLTLSTFSNSFTTSTAFFFTAAPIASIPRLTHAPKSFNFIDASSSPDLLPVSEVLTPLTNLLEPNGILKANFTTYPTHPSVIAASLSKSAAAAETQLAEESDRHARAAKYVLSLHAQRAPDSPSSEILPLASTQQKIKTFATRLTNWSSMWETYTSKKNGGVDLEGVAKALNLKNLKTVRLAEKQVKKARMGREKEVVAAAERVEEMVVGGVEGGEMGVLWEKVGGEGKGGDEEWKGIEEVVSRREKEEREEAERRR